mmetsp:Transcript_38052/g.101197  ORF Transcript_38052/g.101197 Transcript_38052/m.101197 type:complete len:207 (+) Transcript_38052:1253-1873(+)
MRALSTSSRSRAAALLSRASLARAKAAWTATRADCSTTSAIDGPDGGCTTRPVARASRTAWSNAWSAACHARTATLRRTEAFSASASSAGEHRPPSKAIRFTLSSASCSSLSRRAALVPQRWRSAVARAKASAVTTAVAAAACNSIKLARQAAAVSLARRTPMLSCARSSRSARRCRTEVQRPPPARRGGLLPVRLPPLPLPLHGG